MPEGSPTDPTPTTETEEVTAEATEAEEVATESRSPEEIEAIWKNRVSQKDKAHAAEAKALREERDAALAAANAKVKAEAVDASEADQWKARAEAAEKAAADERQARIIDVRSAKYPAAAEALGADVIAAMDEGKLAAANARLSSDEPPAPSPMDPNAAPKRNPAPPKSAGDKSVADLESDLRKFSPEFSERIANG